jgi:hypothetical protein
MTEPKAPVTTARPILLWGAFCVALAAVVLAVLALTGRLTKSQEQPRPVDAVAGVSDVIFSDGHRPRAGTVTAVRVTDLDGLPQTCFILYDSGSAATSMSCLERRPG